MSQNLDLVRSVFTDLERGDLGHAEWADPDIEWVVADGPTAASYTGVADMAGGFRSMLKAWDDLRFYVDEYRELDDDRVLVLMRLEGYGKTSGLDVGKLHPRGAAVCHVHSGRVTKLINYWDRDRALADLGLEE